MHLQRNRCHIFTKKRGTYGIIADGLRFATQLSNVYGNAIRAKLAAAQTTRSVAGSFSSFVTQNLQSICSLYHRSHAFFINLRNPIPLQMHESPPFATPDAKSCFCFPSLWQRQCGCPECGPAIAHNINKLHNKIQNDKPNFFVYLSLMRFFVIF